MKLSSLMQKFVLHFGEMGSRWGINRTVGQIYALLFASVKSLNADEISEALEISRSNVSVGLKELQSWQLVRLEHRPGDRRDYFRSPEDVWQIFRTLADQRRRREVDPTLTMLRETLLEPAQTPEDLHVQQRMQQMHDLIELVTGWFADVQRLDQPTLTKLMKMGSRVHKLLDFKVVAGGKN